jgi:hypothetical protein
MGEYVLLGIFISNGLLIKHKIFSNDLIIMKGGVEIMEEVKHEIKDLDSNWV